ncbi:protein kinase [Dongia soli]|uniref:Protein kinase n=1 Tax=Dongia soli TaxID=600628 RepID=A0ABU5EH88_9PROT|nr:protein kinase [Dongia soli]MDY0885379.1 protein kinase [Dongia soli]
MTAAEKLEGMTLSGGWKVTKHLARRPNGSGGMFSHSYEVEKSDKRGFLKAFDFTDAFEPGAETIELLQILISAYHHEREILAHCRERRLSNVVLAIEHGNVDVPGYSQMEGRVYYLIFEMADGDVRCQMNTNLRLDNVWCMHVLKSVCLGLWQIHKEMIAHQDIKPSNILLYTKAGSKIADFGRSARKGHPVWHDDRKFAGDRSYAPPELLYGYTHADFVPRRMGCDLYMLGNLAAFLFTGVNVTAEICAAESAISA